MSVPSCSTLRRWGRPVAALVALQTAACLTVNVYFPEAAIRDLSQQIEAEVRREAGLPAEPPAAAPEGAAASGESVASVLGAIADVAVATLWTTPAYAQTEVPTPTITNPAIRKIIESRSARLDELNALKSDGVVGESNRALVEVRDLEKVADLRQRAAAQRLVKAENDDREKLFREIAAAENVDLSQLDRIQSTYAETMHQYARPGDWIQRPNGEWVQK